MPPQTVSDSSPTLQNIQKRFDEEGSELHYIQQEMKKARSMLDECHNRRRSVMRQIRSEMGLSAESFGKLVGFTAPYIFMLESGKYQWSDAAIDRLDASLQEEK